MTTFEKLSVPRPSSPTTTGITRCPPRRERAPQPPRLLLAPPCAPRYSFARGPPWPHNRPRRDPCPSTKHGVSIHHRPRSHITVATHGRIRVHDRPSR